MYNKLGGAEGAGDFLHRPTTRNRICLNIKQFSGFKRGQAPSIGGDFLHRIGRRAARGLGNRGPKYYICL